MTPASRRHRTRPEGNERRAKVFLVRPAREASDVEAWVSACLKRARDIDPGPTIFRARRARLAGERRVGGVPQRTVDLLEPEDANGLYRALHRAPAIVLVFGAVYVRRNPSRNPPARRDALSLGTYVAHKAVYGLVRGEAAIHGHFARYLAWKDAINCAGEDDPRVLALHVFQTSAEWTDLGDPEVDRAFADRYGPAASRHDEGNKRWARAARSAYHGRETLMVAGCSLAPGMHWDVTPNRGQATLHNSHEVWLLPAGRRSYLNVEPDGRVRKTSASTARRVWPRTRGRR